MSEFDFDFKPRRPLWKDLMLFVGTVSTVWGGTHFFLNYNAFAQIIAFKYDTLRASVIETFEPAPAPVQTEPLKLERVKHTNRRPLFRDRTLKPKNHAKTVFRQMPVYPSDNRIYIPRIKKNVPLVTVPNHQNWQQLETNIQDGLRNGVVVHPVSHAPGSFGNFFVTGHSSYYAWDPGRFKDVFALLHEVEPGDIVEVYWEGKKYTYRMKTEKVVPPTAVDVLNQPKHESVLTLMTCTPVGTNKNRLILVGELLEEDPAYIIEDSSSATTSNVTKL